MGKLIKLHSAKNEKSADSPCPECPVVNILLQKKLDLSDSELEVDPIVDPKSEADDSIFHAALALILLSQYIYFFLR